MTLTTAQIKGKIKSIANRTNADARLLMRIYMMDRFLDRLACSKYKDNFIIKGGILVTSMVGVAMRSTMDIDASIKNLNLSAEDALKVVTEIIEIPLDDGITFEIKKVDNIMDNFEYPGIRIEMNAIIGGMITPIKLDISTGDVITPRAIEYEYSLLLDDRTINLWAYNLETVLAEKIQTILSRSLLNTRMRDFYDVYTLMNLYSGTVDQKTLHDAFIATSQKRGYDYSDINSQMESIAASDILQNLWKQYQNKFSYASDISFEDVIDSANVLIQMIGIS